jgi:hypothetical protein
MQFTREEEITAELNMDEWVPFCSRKIEFNSASERRLPSMTG